MRTRWSAALILGTFMMLPLSAVQADEGGSSPGGNGEMRHWMHGEGHGHEDLGVTDDQETKLKAIREAREKALKPLWRKQRDLSFKLRDQLDDKASDADIQRTLSDLKANRETLESDSKRFEIQKEAILTPTQRARLMLMHGLDGGHSRYWEHDKMGHQSHGGDEGEDHRPE